MKTHPLLLFILALISVLFVSCRKTDTDEIKIEKPATFVGSWISDTTGEYGMWQSKYVLKENGTMYFYPQRMWGRQMATPSDTGYWTLTGDTCIQNDRNQFYACGNHVQLITSHGFVKGAARVTRDTLYIDTYCCYKKLKFFREY